MSPSNDPSGKVLRRALDLPREWRIVGVELSDGSLDLFVRVEPSSCFIRACPDCGGPARIHDHLERRWRHLDVGVLRTLLVARVPRIRCAGDKKVRLAPVPWSARSGRFARAFNAQIVALLAVAPVRVVRRVMRLTVDEVRGVRRKR